MKKIETPFRSGLFIFSQKYLKKPPLILSEDLSSDTEYYNGEKWGDQILDKDFLTENWETRTIPGQNRIWPCISGNDFLEDSLIKLPFPIDKKRFFDGNPKDFYEGDIKAADPPEDSYLLPIKPLFFHFFDTLFLTKKINNQFVFQFIKVGIDGVKVELRIPIKGNKRFVLFEKLYFPNENPDLERKRGSIIEQKISLGFFPFGHFLEKTERRVCLVDGGYTGNDLKIEFGLDFFVNHSKKPINIITKTRRSDKNKHNRSGSTDHYLLDRNFDFLQVFEKKRDSKRNAGIIIPLVTNFSKGGNSFTFALDFRKNFTNLFYAKNKGYPKVFDITESDALLVTLFDKVWEKSIFDVQLRDLLHRELIPREISTKKSKYQFPIISVVSEIEGLRHNKPTLAIGDINIPFFHGYKEYLNSSVITTNLSWNNNSNTDNEKSLNRVSKFIETLLILMKNKVLLNSGDLSKVNFIYLLDTSLNTYQRNTIEKKVTRLFRKHFTNTAPPYFLRQSIAPIFSTKIAQVNTGNRINLSIDIQKEKTHIICFEGVTPIFITSIPFGENAVFGDAYEDGIVINNGFVKAYKPKIRQFFNENQNKLYQLSQAFAEIEGSQKFSSSDLIAFFFSIEDNKDVKCNDLEFSFSSLIADDSDFKIVFIVFYAAIIYHTATLMKLMELKMPYNICLSGNGAKIINFLDQNLKLATVEKFSKLIFQKIYEVDEYHNRGLKIIQPSEFKGATCIGGIQNFRQGGTSSPFDSIVLFGGKLPKKDENGNIMKDYEDKPIMEDIYINEDETNFEKSSLRYERIQDPGHPEHKQAVEKEVLGFIDFLFELHKDFNFSTNFGVNSGDMKWYKDILTRDIGSSIETGLERQLQLTDESDNIGESLFFYPLIASLYELAEKIAEKRI